MNYFKDKLKIELFKNSKKPAVSWSDKDTHKKDIDQTKFNIGILTGEKNNLIVLDVDTKDEGIEEINKYIKDNGIINTFTTSTPSGGFHYYFKYKHSNQGSSYLIKEQLKNSSGYRNKGLDIRTNGGYIVAPPSKIYNKEYTIIKDVEPQEMPESLILWLLEGKKQEKEQPEKKRANRAQDKGAYSYNITDEQINNLLNKLPSEYYENYDEWLIILTVLKSLNKFDIFDKFSKKSKAKYDKPNNIILWNANAGNIDINYLILRMNSELKLKNELVEKFKPVNNTLETTIKTQTINTSFLKYEYQQFVDNETIIIRSSTGTGKTTNTAENIKQYLTDNPQYTILSIVNIISLANQQIKTFKDKGLTLKSYQTILTNELLNNNVVICINSLLKYKSINKDVFKNYIVYIDEIYSFLETLTHCDTLKHIIKPVYCLLVDIIKNCHKLIVSDAIINNNVLNLIKYRNKETTIFINNEFKKYKDIPAIRCNDEKEFINKLKQDIINKLYFLFGCDSCDIVTKLYKLCLESVKEEDKDKLILITSETNFKLEDATKQFKDKFIFYSPSITTGVDFSISTAQNQYIYIKGKSINPASMFQQTTRTRNINKVYYYVDTSPKKAKFNTLQDLQKYYIDMVDIDEKLKVVCLTIDEDDQMKINENIFFKLWTFNEFNLLCYNTNKKYHYENILTCQGFNLSEEGEHAKISKETKADMKTKKQEQNEDDFKQFIKLSLEQNEEINNSKKNSIFMLRQGNLNIKGDEIEKYKELIQDEYKYNSYFSFLKLFKTEKYINDKIIKNDNFKIKEIDNAINKIYYLKKFEKLFNIKPFNFDVDINDVTLLTDDNYNLIKEMFGTIKSKTKPKTGEQVKLLYYWMISDICGSLVVLTNKRTMNKNKAYIYKYEFNKELIKNYLELAQRDTNKFKNYDVELLKKFNIEFVEIDKKYNKYLF